LRITSNNIRLTILVSALVFSSTISFAEAPVPNDMSLKEVMQGLLEDSIEINRGIFLEDYSLIEQAADRVANHPTPPMATKKKLMMGLGLDMRKFKSFDDVVHDLAVEIGQSAEKEDMKSVVKKYHDLMDGCLSCHDGFKVRVSRILE